jgi:hypothetical protein
VHEDRPIVENALIDLHCTPLSFAEENEWIGISARKG